PARPALGPLRPRRPEVAARPPDHPGPAPAAHHRPAVRAAVHRHRSAVPALRRHRRAARNRLAGGGRLPRPAAAGPPRLRHRPLVPRRTGRGAARRRRAPRPPGPPHRGPAGTGRRRNPPVNPADSWERRPHLPARRRAGPPEAPGPAEPHRPSTRDGGSPALPGQRREEGTGRAGDGGPSTPAGRERERDAVWSGVHHAFGEPRRPSAGDGGPAVRSGRGRAKDAVRTAVRRAPAAAAGAAALLLLAACTGSGPRETADAEPRDDPPAPAPEVPAAGVPPSLAAEPAWLAPFSAPPKASGDGFVGPVMPEESGGDLVFLGVGPDGATRWSLSRNPSCTAFAATRDADGGDLVVVLDSDADPERALLASRTTAAGYRPDDGALVWGPVEVPGTLVGPGLVFGAPAKSVMSADTGPKTALDPSTGRVAADEEDGGAAVLHEHQGALLTEEDGELRAVDAAGGE